MKSLKNGFSLLELVFAVAIVGVLTAVAVPTYQRGVEKTDNNKAIQDLQNIQNCLEKYFTDNFNYPENLDELGSCVPNNGKDPWGNDYIYLNIIDGGPGIMGDVRKDRKLNPINTNYDLYSMGKDGVTKTQVSQKDSLDDIILARDGAYVGLAADF